MTGASNLISVIFRNWRAKIVAPILFGIGLVSTFAGQLALSHVTTAADFGIYILIYNAAAVLSALGAAGYDLTAVRFVANALNRKDNSYIHSYLRHAVKMSGALALIAAALMLAYLAGTVGLNWPILGLALLVTLLWSWSRLAAGILRGLDRLSFALISDRVSRDFLVMLLAISALLLTTAVPIHMALLILAIGSLFGIVIGSAVSRQYLRSAAQRQRDNADDVLPALTPAEPRLWLLASLGLLAYNIAELLSSRFDVFALSYLSTAEAVGAFGLGLLLINLVTIPSGFITMLLMPAVAIAHHDGDRARLRRLFVLSTSASFATGICIAAVLAFLMPYLDRFLPPATVASLRPELLGLAIGVRVLCLIGTFPPVLLMMAGGHRQLILAHAASIAVRVILFVAFGAIVDANFAILTFVAGTVVVTALNLWQVLPGLFKGQGEDRKPSSPLQD